MEVTTKSLIYTDYTALLGGMDRMNTMLNERRKLLSSGSRRGHKVVGEVTSTGDEYDSEMFPSLAKRKTSAHVSQSYPPPHIAVYDRLLKMKAREMEYSNWVGETLPALEPSRGFRGVKHTYNTDNKRMFPPEKSHLSALAPRVLHIHGSDARKTNKNEINLTLTNTKAKVQGYNQRRLFLGSTKRGLTQLGLELKNGRLSKEDDKKKDDGNREAPASPNSTELIPLCFHLPASSDGATPEMRHQNFTKLGMRRYISFCSRVASDGDIEVHSNIANKKVTGSKSAVSQLTGYYLKDREYTNTFNESRQNANNWDKESDLGQTEEAEPLSISKAAKTSRSLDANKTTKKKKVPTATLR